MTTTPTPTQPPAAPQPEQPGATTQVVATAPRRIWLDLGFDPAVEDAPFSEVHEATWSANNATGHGIEYVRADLAAPAPTTEQAGKYGSPQYWVATALAELDGVETDDDNNCMKSAKSALRKALAAAPGGEAPAEDARAEAALRKVLTAVQNYLPPDGVSLQDTMTAIIEIVDPWPLSGPKE